MNICHNIIDQKNILLDTTLPPPAFFVKYFFNIFITNIFIAITNASACGNPFSPFKRQNAIDKYTFFLYNRIHKINYYKFKSKSYEKMYYYCYDAIYGNKCVRTRDS